jgi:phospholipid-binding lipoprotein MlaA
MLNRFFLISLVVLLSGCRTVTTYRPDDPLESLNRPVEVVNAHLDFWVMTPTSFVYRSVVPNFLRHGIHRMFLNLGEISNAVNAGLQGQWSDVENSVERFAINSTLGFLGFFDRAQETGRLRTPHDFGETLYHLGYKESTFIMIPLLGPSTIRDGLSFIVDNTLLNPAIYLSKTSDKVLAVTGEILDAKASHDQKFEQLKPPEYFDRYIIIKDAFLQNRNYILNPESVEEDYSLDY